MSDLDHFQTTRCSAMWRHEPAGRIERFHERAQEVDGIPLQVLENIASAGDVILMHPLLLHAPPTTILEARRVFR